MKLLSYLADRLHEKSTWQGIVLVLSVLGAKFSPEQSEAIINSGLSLVGTIQILTKEKNKSGSSY